MFVTINTKYIIIVFVILNVAFTSSRHSQVPCDCSLRPQGRNTSCVQGLSTLYLSNWFDVCEIRNLKIEIPSSRSGHWSDMKTTSLALYNFVRNEICFFSILGDIRVQSSD